MLRIINNNACTGFKMFKIKNMIYLHCFSINDNKFFKLTLFLLIKWAEAALIYKAVIVRNLINQAAPMAIKNIETT